MVEYCSPLSKKDGKYAWNENKKNNDRGFFGIGCDCINSDYNGYDGSKINSGYCQHATLISDSVTINFVEKEVLLDENNNEYSESKQMAIEGYDERVDYDQRCNLELKRIIDNDQTLK